MQTATIQFDGPAFHWGAWNRILREADFRVAGSVAEDAVYASGGNIIIGKSRPPSLPHACKWEFELKETRAWHGWLKFYSVLIGAFAVPQPVTVIIADASYVDRDALKQAAEAALIERFSSDKLISHGVLHPRLGIQLV